MRGTRLFWKLYPSYFLVTLLSLVFASWLVSGTIKEFHIGQVYTDLKAKAQLISHGLAEDHLGLTNTNQMDVYCKEIGGSISTRITVISPDGRVMCDSHKDPRQMDNHADRPEVKKALEGHIGSSIRYSHTLQTNMMYVAIPVIKRSRTVAIVRTSMPLSAVNDALGSIRRKVLAWSIVAAVLAGLLCFVISCRISRPIEKLTREVLRLPKQSIRNELLLPGSSSKEFIILAGAISRMAAELNERMRIIEENRSKLKAILSTMWEGIIAIDQENRIVVMNEAAGKLLDVDPHTAQGQFLEEAVRNHTLQELVREVFSSGNSVEGEIVIPETILQVHGSPLRGSTEEEMTGVLIVLNDVTRLRQMERTRKEFVANVSHELKTPITAIKGFAETLLDGAIYDTQNAEHFLRIIAVHADRMERIIQDLLTLSRLEQDVEREAIEFTEVKLSEVVNEAVAACALSAESKDIQIGIDVPDDLIINANPRLLEQALINLIDNAIKYSEPGRHTYVKGTTSGDMVVISVRDEGCGIEKEHIPRIFERFYRVDKARSRKLGGTGLGLAIVKHVALIHGGRVDVESNPGKGSVFFIYMPMRQ